MNATHGNASVWSGTAAGRRSATALRTLAAVGAAVLIAAAGFVVARSFGRTIPPAAVCSETCAPTRTAAPPATRRIGVARPTSSKHGRGFPMRAILEIAIAGRSPRDTLPTGEAGPGAKGGTR
jgi:hypothetical protein